MAAPRESLLVCNCCRWVAPPSPPPPLPPPSLPPQVNSMRIFSDRQATDLLKEISGEITLLLLPASGGVVAALREHLLASAATSTAANGAGRCLVGPPAPLGPYFLQPIYPMPPGLTLPPGCTPGGFLVYLTPLPAADCSFSSAAFLPAAALPAAALPAAAFPAAALPAAAPPKRETAAEAHGSGSAMGSASLGSAFRPPRVLNASPPPPTRSPMRPAGATHSRTRSGDYSTLTRSGEVRGDAVRAAGAGQRTAECFVMGEACAAPSRPVPAPAAPFAEGRTAHAVMIEDDVLEQSLDNSMDLTGCLVRPV